MRRFSVLVLHRRAGKTELALRELIDKALRCDLELGLYLYVAPQLKQAKAIAWARLKQILHPVIMGNMVTVNEAELWVRFRHNDAQIRLYGADNPDAMRGLRVDGVVVDEVKDVKPETWTDVLQPALADRLGWALFIGTPDGINLFSELYFRGRDAPDWHTGLYTVYDTDALDPAEVERYRQSVSDITFRREMMCDFAAAGDDQVISLQDIHLASGRHLDRTDYDFASRVIGVDPARFGDDRSVIFCRQGLRAYEPLIFHGVDNMTLAARVAQEMERFSADAVFIDAGGGGGVIDRLRQLNHHVIEVNFAGTATSPQYLNKRAEMWFEMRDWLVGGGSIPPMPDLRQDLAAPTYKFTPADKIQLESKDDIRKRGLPSPDLGDALALTFAQPVYASNRVEADARRLGLPVKTQHPLDYNPYATI